MSNQMTDTKEKNQKPEKEELFNINLDKRPFKVPSPQSVTSLLALVGKTLKDWHLQIKLAGGAREILDPNKPVDLSRPGVERFETVPAECSNG